MRYPPARENGEGRSTGSFALNVMGTLPLGHRCASSRSTIVYSVKFGPVRTINGDHADGTVGVVWIHVNPVTLHQPLPTSPGSPSNVYCNTRN